MAYVLSGARGSTFAAGMDPTRDDVCFCLPTLGQFKYVQELCLRTTLCGSNMEVVLLEEGMYYQAGTAPGQGTVLQLQDCTQNVAPAPRLPRITRSYRRNVNAVPVYPPSPTAASSGTKRKLGGSRGNDTSGNKRAQVVPSEPTKAEVISEVKGIPQQRNNLQKLQIPLVCLLTDWHKAMPAVSPTDCIFKDSWPYTAREESD
jgi:hypothetical protein